MSFDVFCREVHEKIEGICSKKEKPKGSMAEGYIVYESFYYVSEYNKQINHTPDTMIWDDESDEDKREWEVLEMNGKRCMINIK